MRGEWVAADQSDPDLGVVLYLHGGGYVAGSPATHRPITAALARLARRRVFSLDYRLAPEHRFPAALDDAAAAYRWLLEQGTPASSLVLAGDSAGGGLVLATLLKVREEGWPAPACAACFSPWTDLAATGESARENDGRCAMLRPDSISAFARLYLGDTPPQHPYASPVYADLGGLPPLLLQVGSDELLLDDTRRIHAKIQAAGGPSTLQIFDGVFHGWHVLAPLLPESRQALHQAAHFLNTPHAPPTRPGRPMPSAQAPPRAGTK
ncbi:MAG TPA: alpha/beta hydrolase [Methylomirabilota bacterium]|nr:alpha/beta hydrolase [Methylomirabilota bacterium]